MSGPAATTMSVPLTEQTEEFGLVEYFLQLSCRTSLVKVRSLWELHLPTVRQHFEQKTTGSLVLPSWLPISQLDHMNGVQEVCQRGFKIDEAGLLVQVGNFALPGVFQEIDEMDNPEEGGGGASGGETDPVAAAKSKQERESQGAMRSKARFLAGGKRLFEVFLCHVGVGKSQLVTPDRSDAFENLDTAKLIADCPSEFDSIYLHRKKKKLFQLCCNKVKLHPYKGSTILLRILHDSPPYVPLPPCPSRPPPSPLPLPPRPTSLPKSCMLTHGAAACETVSNFVTDHFQDIHGGIAPQHTFQHDYVIREHSQILPVFLVHFELDTTKTDSLLLAVCDSCQAHPAVVWCESDAAKLCEECDTELML